MWQKFFYHRIVEFKLAFLSVEEIILAIEYNFKIEKQAVFVQEVNKFGDVIPTSWNTRQRCKPFPVTFDCTFNLLTIATW